MMFNISETTTTIVKLGLLSSWSVEGVSLGMWSAPLQTFFCLNWHFLVHGWFCQDVLARVVTITPLLLAARIVSCRQKLGLVPPQGQHCSKIMKSPQSLPLQMAECLFELRQPITLQIARSVIDVL